MNTEAFEDIEVGTSFRVAYPTWEGDTVFMKTGDNVATDGEGDINFEDGEEVIVIGA